MITKERIQEILSKYKTDDALFNWCEEYKSFISDCIGGCVSSEVEYILKKSYEEQDTPLSYEDLDLFDIDKAKESILYLFDDKSEEEQKAFIKEINEEHNRKIKNKGGD